MKVGKEGGSRFVDGIRNVGVGTTTITACQSPAEYSDIVRSITNLLGDHACFIAFIERHKCVRNTAPV